MVGVEIRMISVVGLEGEKGLNGTLKRLSVERFNRQGLKMKTTEISRSVALTLDCSHKCHFLKKKRHPQAVSSNVDS